MSYGSKVEAFEAAEAFGFDADSVVVSRDGDGWAWHIRVGDGDLVTYEFETAPRSVDPVGVSSEIAGYGEAIALYARQAKRAAIDNALLYPPGWTHVDTTPDQTVVPLFPSVEPEAADSVDLVASLGAMVDDLRGQLATMHRAYDDLRSVSFVPCGGAGDVTLQIHGSMARELAEPLAVSLAKKLTALVTLRDAVTGAVVGEFTSASKVERAKPTHIVIGGHSHVAAVGSDGVNNWHPESLENSENRKIMVAYKARIVAAIADLDVGELERLAGLKTTSTYYRQMKRVVAYELPLVRAAIAARESALDAEFGLAAVA